MITITSLYKEINGKHILKDINLNLEKNEINVLIGPSGSGKSTLLRLIANIDNPTSGSIDFGLENINKKQTGTIWPMITLVFQQLYLWPNLTLRQNIMLPFERGGIEFNQKYFDELCLLFELNDILNHYPNESSLGQQQRIAFIRAILLKPKFILLDEITSSLDIEFANKVGEVLIELKSNYCGFLIVTHLIGFAKRIADKVIFLDNGKIIETGGKEILIQPKSERVKSFVNNL